MVQATTLRFSSSTRLDSWKSVAGYLGCSPRTAQRWFSEYNLPVRRVGNSSGRIFAYVDELDTWLRSRGESPSASYRHYSECPVLEMAPPDEKANRLRPSCAHFPFLIARHERSSELLAIAEKMWNTLSASDLGVITRLYREAIDSNPEDATAFAGVTTALIAGALFDNITISCSSIAARFALQQAREFDAGSAEVQTARAWVGFILERDRCGARQDFDRALARRRSFAPAVVGRALLHIADRELVDAASLLHDFTAQYPLSAPAMMLRCWVEYLAGDAASARHLVAQARRDGLTGSLLDALEATAIIDLNIPTKSIQPLQALAARWSVDCPHYSLLQGVLGYCYAVSGRGQDAHDMLRRITESAAGQDTEVAYPLALVALGLGDHAGALRWLGQSDSGRSLWSLGFEVDPILAPLRAAPQYQPLTQGSARQAPAQATSQLACVG